MTETLTSRTNPVEHPILDVLVERWSPRAFTGAPIDDGALNAIIEAARWAPSAFNSQPWGFIVARRGSEAFERVVGSLMGFNQAWAHKAGALVVAVADTSDPKNQTYPIYDLGQSVAHLSIQAHAEGLHVHQMAGFSADTISEAFELGDGLRPLTVIAIGDIAPADTLEDETLREREAAPRERKPRGEVIIAEG